jgi:hypothetical protein
MTNSTYENEQLQILIYCVYLIKDMTNSTYIQENEQLQMITVKQKPPLSILCRYREIKRQKRRHGFLQYNGMTFCKVVLFTHV